MKDRVVLLRVRPVKHVVKGFPVLPPDVVLVLDLQAIHHVGVILCTANDREDVSNTSGVGETNRETKIKQNNSLLLVTKSCLSSAGVMYLWGSWWKTSWAPWDTLPFPVKTNTMGSNLLGLPFCLISLPTRLTALLASLREG